MKLEGGGTLKVNNLGVFQRNVEELVEGEVPREMYFVTFQGVIQHEEGDDEL